ncbi:MAG: putative 2OG-Fe(II) oxygenase, partial [Promethearchaeota archaeon]
VFYTHEAKGVKNYFDSENNYTWKTFYVEPEDGMLVIFKANLMHGVTQNKTNKTRVSFAYNYKIT